MEIQKHNSKRIFDLRGRESSEQCPAPSKRMSKLAMALLAIAAFFGTIMLLSGAFLFYLYLLGFPGGGPTPARLAVVMAPFCAAPMFVVFGSLGMAEVQKGRPRSAQPKKPSNEW